MENVFSTLIIMEDTFVPFRLVVFLSRKTHRSVHQLRFLLLIKWMMYVSCLISASIHRFVLFRRRNNHPFFVFQEFSETQEAIEKAKQFVKKYSISTPHSVFHNRKYVVSVQQTQSGINVFIDAEMQKKMQEKEKEQDDSDGSDDLFCRNLTGYPLCCIVTFLGFDFSVV